jgi:hypothetical protein
MGGFKEAQIKAKKELKVRQPLVLLKINPSHDGTRSIRRGSCVFCVTRPQSPQWNITRLPCHTGT